MRYAQTVTGPLPASELGLTLMHEHVLCDLRQPGERGPADRHPPITMANRFATDYFQNRNPLNMWLDEGDVALAELAAFKAVGGGAIVELTIGGIAPQPDRLRAISAESGVPVVMGAGFYVDAYLDDAIRNASVEALEATIEAQLTTGLWGSDVKAGLIGEIGCSWPLTPTEARVLEAAARVSGRTGAALTIHPGRHPDAPREIAAAVPAAGGDPAQTVIGHIDRTIFDGDRLLELLDFGFVLEWDFFGIETSQYWMADTDLDLPTDYMRLDTLRFLIDRGHLHQLCLSHDICTRTRLCAYGGHGYRHLPAHVVPLMRRRGFSEQEVETLLVKTPARLLGYLEAPAEGL